MVSYAGLRDGRKAMRLAFDVCERGKWVNAFDIDTLAAAHAEVGDFAGAVLYQERACTLGKPEEVEDYMARLALYAQKKPYRQPGPAVAPAPREVKPK